MVVPHSCDYKAISAPSWGLAGWLELSLAKFKYIYMFFTEKIHSYLYSNKNFKIDIFVFNIEKKIRAANWQQVYIWKSNVNMTFNSFKQMVSE